MVTWQVNEPYTSHTWTAPGDYLVALWAYNDSYPEGVSATVTIHVEEGLHYVAATSGNPVAPYTSWATAATNIQDAVDVAATGRDNFRDQRGSTPPSTVDTPLIVAKRQRPGRHRNQWRWHGAVPLPHQQRGDGGLHLDQWCAENGGGVYCESTSAVLTNCVLTGNSADYDGGGAYGGTLNNCTLTGNSA